MSKNKTSSVLIYSQHLRCMARLLKNTAQTEVFTYLFDEYLHLVRQGHVNPGVTKTMTAIAENTGIYRGRVEERLRELADLNLIRIVDKVVYIQANFLVSVATLLYSKHTASEKKEVCAAFQNKDIEKLKSLGLNDCLDGEKQLSEAPGSLMLISHQSDAISSKCCKISKVMRNQQSDAISSKNDAISSQMLISQHLFGEILTHFPKKSDFMEAFYHQNDAISAKQAVLDAADVIYDAKSAFSTSEALEKMLILQHFWVMQYQHFVAISATVNNNIKKINKRNNQSEALAKEREGLFEQEGDFEQDEPCVNFQNPLTTIELKDMNHSEELSEKGKQVYPFFSVQEVDEIVNNLQLAKTSSLKLFLYNLWGYASDLTHEGYDQEVDEEEQEILSEEDFFDPDGSIITKSDYRQLLLESYEQTAADIEKGCIELDDETVSLSIKEIFPRDMLFKILDWETAALSCREMSVIISKSRIRNIEAKTISAVHQPKTREERRQAAKEGRGLMKRLYKAKQDKGLYSQLTSIEKIAADVIAQYFAPNPDKEDRAPFILKDGPIMIKENWRALKVQITQAGLKESDFLSTLLNNKGPNDSDQLILQEPLFLLAGIKAINETYQQESILDTISADE